MNSKANCKCQTVLSYIDSSVGYIDSKLHLKAGDEKLPQEAEYVFEHIQTCANCRHQFELAQTVSRQLQDSPIEPMRLEFPTELFAQLAQTQRATNNRRGWSKGHIVSLLATAATFLVFTLLVLKINQPWNAFNQSLSDNHIAAIQIHYEEVKNIRLVFNAPADIEHANFEISLPESVRIEGYSGTQLAWQAPLKAGKNTLVLPLYSSANPKSSSHSKAASGGLLTAKLSLGKHTKEFKLRLLIEGKASNIKT